MNEKLNSQQVGKGGRGGGFFLACKDYGGKVIKSFPFFLVEISLHAAVPIFQAKDKSTVVEQAEK